MKIHFCPFDKDCRRSHAPARIHIFTRRWAYMMALSRDAKMQKTGTFYPDIKWGWFRRDERRDWERPG